jgi:hypothetical protein
MREHDPRGPHVGLWMALVAVGIFLTIIAHTLDRLNDRVVALEATRPHHEVEVPSGPVYWWDCPITPTPAPIFHSMNGGTTSWYATSHTLAHELTCQKYPEGLYCNEGDHIGFYKKAKP